MDDDPKPEPEIDVTVTGERIDMAAQLRAMEDTGKAGGIVTFSGYCRDEGGRLSALEIEHYPGMAEREIVGICEQACERWDLLRCSAVHRHGTIRPGEEIVFVGCAAVHRKAAFEAATFVMDFMKSKAPFWKREHLDDGSVGEWVSATDTDDAAAERWHQA